MKHAWLVILALSCAANTLGAQDVGDKPAKPRATCHIEARLDFAAGQSYALSGHFDLTNGWKGRVVGQGRVGDQGQFRLDFALDAPQVAVLTIGRTLRRLWLVPGRLRVTSRNGSAWTFEGDGARENEALEKADLNRFSAPQPRLETFVPAEYRARVEEAAKAQREACADVLRRKDAFATYVEAEILGSAANACAVYPVHASMKGLIKLASTPPSAFEFWKSFPILGDRSVFASGAYRQALGACLEHRAAERLRKRDVDPHGQRDDWALETIEVCAEVLKAHPGAHETIVASKVNFMLQYCSAQAAAKAIEVLRRRFPRSRYLPFLTKHLQARNIDLKRIADEVRFVDKAGASHSLADLRGKVVYVDFWGVWCKACMAQMPALAKLAQEFEGEDVVVLGVNMLDSKKAWRDALEAKGLSGLQWKPGTKESEARLSKLVHLRAYPRFMLIGRDGQLVSSAAPPPAQAAAAIRKALSK